MYSWSGSRMWDAPRGADPPPVGTGGRAFLSPTSESSRFTTLLTLPAAYRPSCCNKLRSAHSNQFGQAVPLCATRGHEQQDTHGAEQRTDECWGLRRFLSLVSRSIVTHRQRRVSCELTCSGQRTAIGILDSVTLCPDTSMTFQLPSIRER